MPSNSGKYNNERRIFYFQDATLRGPRGSLNRNIDIFGVGGGGGGGEGHPSAKRALGRSHLPVNTKSK